MFGSAKFGWLNTLKKLPLKPQLHVLAKGEPFCQVEVAPEEIRTTQGITAEVSELAILCAVAAIALPCTRIDRRHKCIRIKPLQLFPPALHPNRMMLVQRNARNSTGQTAVRCPARCRFRLLNKACLARERNPRCAKRCPRNLPAVERVAQRMTVHFERKLINILRVEIMPDVIVGTAHNRGPGPPQRRENPSCGKGKGTLRSRPYPCNGSSCS